MQIAYIGMGGNISSAAGQPEKTLAGAAERLGTLGRVVCRSSLYSTEPVGFADQARFVNAVVAVETDWTARVVLENLLRIEREFGRDRSAGIQNGPRTLDLDLLLLGGQVIREPGLEVPHPRLAERAFVLVPLNEIAPELMIVTHGTSVKELLRDLRLRHPTENDAVLPIQSDHWNPGPCGRGGVRPNESDRHGNG